MDKKTDEKYLDLANKVDDLMNSKLSPYGEFVRAIRQSRGLYLKQMADFIGIGSAHMSGIEFGRYELTKEILQKTFEFFTQTPAVEPAHKYTSVYACNVVGIYKDGEQMTIDQIVADLNAKAVEPAMLNTCLSNAKQEQSGWLRAIDEALVCHHVGVANVSDTYEQAKDKLNKMLCVVQDIGSYFAKQEPAQAAIKCKDCLDTGEQLGVYGRIKCSCKEPAQAVPVDDEAAFRNYACRCKTLWAGLDWDNQVVEIAREAYLAGRKNSVPPAIDDETCKMALLIREAVNKGIFQGAIRRDAISILSRLTIFHGGENDSSR